MREDDENDQQTYKVVINREEQYSIWFADRDSPSGWSDVGKSGSKAECLAHIDEVWTDMRPLSLRKRMEEMARNPPPAPIEPAPDEQRPGGKDSLVERLEVLQEVEAGLRPGRDVPSLKAQLDRGYVFVRFLATGTELGVRLDRSACDLSPGDFETGTGVISLVGGLTLNDNIVRYRGELDLASLKGRGRLEFVREVDAGASDG